MADQTPIPNFVLPTLVFGVVEIRRLLRELTVLDDYLLQTGLRQAGTAQAAPPRASRLLDAVASDNNLNLLQKEDRQTISAFLQAVQERAPTIHLSFASDPSAVFLGKVVGWLRGNIHPLVLIQLGLQPAIAAGCVLRTTNKSFDFSLRHRFDEQRELLVASLDSGGQPAVQTAPAMDAAPLTGGAA